MILPSLKEASTDRAVRGAPIRVLVYLHGILDTEEYRPLKQARVELAIGMDRGDVSRAFKRLIAHRYICEGPRQEHGQRCYRIFGTRPEQMKKTA